ncbi:hypothetical protein QTG56_25110 (plasmid) [Rossellomorea sp. AcN35-11]|nr:hypothetical protein [Rossellomorea aquimaris]WJV31914.1 hypothetical protein QTG56_25110 [Rossellomorea sp. AcN35-11]
MSEKRELTGFKDDAKIAEHYGENDDHPFTYQDLEELNVKDAKEWLDDGEMVGIVSEVHGGIIGYVHKIHAADVTTILNLHMIDHSKND